MLLGWAQTKYYFKIGFTYINDFYRDKNVKRNLCTLKEIKLKL